MFAACTVVRNQYSFEVGEKFQSLVLQICLKLINELNKLKWMKKVTKDGFLSKTTSSIIIIWDNYF